MPGSHRIVRQTLFRIFFLACLVLALLAKTPAVHAQTAQRAVVSRAKPEYPELAMRMRISGKVTVLASVDPNGSVSRVHATSGHPFLQGPAEQAVRQWKFSKATTSTETTVEVQFDLGPRS